MDFGLGLVLSFTDNASSGINRAVNSLSQLTTVAENAGNSLNQVASLSALSVVSGQLGDSFLNMGSSILGVFTNLLGNVQSTGSEFESFRITLNALYGDAEKADKAISKLLDFSIESPFEVDGVKDMLLVLKSQGIDAFNGITGSISNTKKETLSWISDLMAFKPDEPTNRWKRALTNYLGSGQDLMLRNILDMGDIEKDVLGHKMGATAEERMNDIVEIVEKSGLTNLSKKLSTTWTGMASNVSDAFTKLYKSIADNGVFENLKSSFMGLTGAILSLDNVQIESIGKTIAEGLNIIVEPMSKAVEKINTLLMTLVELCQTNPRLIKFGIVLTAIAGSILVLTGIFLKVTSALSGVSLMILATGNTVNTIGGLFKTGALKIKGVLLPLTVALGLLYIAWKSDFIGIRSNTIAFVQGICNSFNTARSTVNGSVDDMISTLEILNQKDTFFNNLTIGIMKFMILFRALKEGWNDFTLSEDTFLKAKELGILPLIEAIFDLKYRFGFFKEGFIAGWKEVSERVKEFIKGIADKLKGTQFEGLFDTVTDILQKLSNNDPESWREFGRVIGELSAKFVVALVALKAFDKTAKGVSGIAKIFTGIVSVVSTIGGVFGNLGSTILNGLSRLFPNIYRLISTGLQRAFGSSLQGIIPNLRIIFANISDVVMNALTGLATAIGVPLSAVVAVIVALIGSVVTYAVVHWEEFKAKIVSIWTTLRDSAIEIWEAIKEGFSRIWTNLQNAIKPVTDAFNTLMGKFSQFKTEASKNEILMSLVEGFSSIGETIVNIVVPAVKGIISILTQGLKGLWNIVVTVFNSIVNIISSVLSNIMNIISGILDIIVGIFTLDFEKILTGVGTILDSVINVISTLLTSAWNIIMSILSGIANVFISIFETIENIVMGAFQGIASMIGSTLDVIFATISSVWDGISNVISNVLGGISKGVQDKWNGIKDTIKNAIEGARDIVKGAIDKIKGFFDFKWELPKLKLPHFSMSGSFSLDPPSVPSIGVDWYAKGGVFDKPSVIGVGEKGKEAVMPLENNTSWISQLAGVISSKIVPTLTPMATNSTSVTNNSGDTNRYLTTNNNNTQTIQGDTDNSVTFAKGAIQINVQNASEEESIRMARKIMDYIKRQTELNNMTMYS